MQPSANTNLRRISILNNMVSSPLRPNNFKRPAPVDLNESNDDVERIKRRSVVDIQKRVSNIADSSYAKEAQKFFDKNEVNSHFQICMKLHTENKITTKNVWKLFITDILPQVVANGLNVLQVAGISLDISAKVYGLRVDTLHDEGLKLASTVARITVKGKSADAENDNNEENIENDENIRTKKKRKKALSTKPRSTIATDPQSLCGDLQKLESVFFSIREDSDISSAQNLFTNRLPLHPLGHKFLLLSKEKCWRSEPSSDDYTKYPLELIKPDTYQICKPFSDFIINEWDPDEEDKQLEIEKSNVNNNEIIFDENGIPIPELDGSLHDIFAENPIESDLEEIDEPSQPIETFNRENILQTHEPYNDMVTTGFAQVFKQLWAGPSHWKVKFIKPSLPKYSGSVVQEQVVAKTNRKRNNKIIDPINFFDEINCCNELDLNKKIRINKKRAVVEIHRLTLPASHLDLRDYIKNIKELCNKPGIMTGKKSLNTLNGDYNVSAYNYNNLNDSQYCSQQATDTNNSHDDDDDDGGTIFNENGEEIVGDVQQRGNFLAENLVDVPELVPDCYISYALRAKPVDTKKLKSAVWKTLTSGNNVPEQVTPIHFSKLYETLPNNLNQEMSKNLNSSQVFVSLLFLCNEHNLKLTQDCNVDFLIESHD